MICPLGLAGALYDINIVELLSDETMKLDIGSNAAQTTMEISKNGIKIYFNTNVSYIIVQC